MYFLIRSHPSHLSSSFLILPHSSSSFLTSIFHLFPHSSSPHLIHSLIDSYVLKCCEVSEGGLIFFLSLSVFFLLSSFSSLDVRFFGGASGVVCCLYMSFSSPHALPLPSTPQYLKKFGCVGAPVYFVLKHGYNFTDLDMQNKICSHLGCNKDALLIQLKLASQIPNRCVVRCSALCCCCEGG